LLWTIAPVNPNVRLYIKRWAANAIAVSVHAQRKLILALAQAFVTHGTSNDVAGFQGEEAKAG
jgi:hypothetical protein